MKLSAILIDLGCSAKEFLCLIKLIVFWDALQLSHSVEEKLF